MAVELTNRLRASTGLALEPTLPFEHPSVHAIADHLGAQLERVVTLKARLAAMSQPPAVSGLNAGILGIFVPSRSGGVRRRSCLAFLSLEQRSS